jgi:hypothetical protein
MSPANRALRTWLQVAGHRPCSPDALGDPPSMSRPGPPAIDASQTEAKRAFQLRRRLQPARPASDPTPSSGPSRGRASPGECGHRRAPLSSCHQHTQKASALRTTRSSAPRTPTHQHETSKAGADLTQPGNGSDVPSTNYQDGLTSSPTAAPARLAERRAGSFPAQPVVNLVSYRPGIELPSRA